MAIGVRTFTSEEVKISPSGQIDNRNFLRSACKVVKKKQTHTIPQADQTEPVTNNCGFNGPFQTLNHVLIQLPYKPQVGLSSVQKNIANQSDVQIMKQAASH